MWKNKVQFFHTSLQNAWGRFAPFPQASPPSIHKQQNRTFHLLQKPDISICYRQEYENFSRLGVQNNPEDSLSRHRFGPKRQSTRPRIDTLSTQPVNCPVCAFEFFL